MFEPAKKKVSKGFFSLGHHYYFDYLHSSAMFIVLEGYDWNCNET